MVALHAQTHLGSVHVQASLCLIRGLLYYDFRKGHVHNQYHYSRQFDQQLCLSRSTQHILNMHAEETNLPDLSLQKSPVLIKTNQNITTHSGRKMNLSLKIKLDANCKSRLCQVPVIINWTPEEIALK